MPVTLRSFALPFVAGLVVGGAVATGATLEVQKRAAQRVWLDAGGDWVRLPGQAPAGTLPQTFTVPARAWDYGATTRALPPTVVSAPSVVRVSVEGVSGAVGVSLAKPDGSALISKEHALKPGPGRQELYFRADPANGPVAVLVRNYDAQGRTGAVTVRRVRYAPLARLSPSDLETVNKAGLY